MFLKHFLWLEHLEMSLNSHDLNLSQFPSSPTDFKWLAWGYI